MGPGRRGVDESGYCFYAWKLSVHGGKRVWWRTVFGFVGSVFVGYAGGFKRETDELAASWNAWPVEELVWWICAGFLTGGHGVEVMKACCARIQWDYQEFRAIADE